MINVLVRGSEQVAQTLRYSAVLIDPKIRALQRHYATVGAASASNRAPRDTGDYAGSIGTAENEHGAEFGSSHPAARRLEFGFHGRDAKGRMYNQRGRPHFGPAADYIKAGYFAGIEAIVADL